MYFKDRTLKIGSYVVAAFLGAALGTLPVVMSYANDTDVTSETSDIDGDYKSASPGANARASIQSNTPGSYGSDANGSTSINTTIPSDSIRSRGQE